MIRYCVAAVAGAWLMSRLPALPSPGAVAAAAILGALCLWRPATRLLAVAVAGALALWAASLPVLEDRLRPELAGRELEFRARITDFAAARSDTLRLVVAPVAAPELPRRLRLSWYGSDAVPAPGEEWVFRARLRRPRGFRNPGGFDYTGWLFRERIGATGYVLAASPEISAAPAGGALRLRRAFVARVEALLPEGDARAALLAITVGARHRISREAWERYAITGTTHLMAISGLHVGLAGGAAFLLGWAVAACLRPRGAALDGGAVAALLAAAGYAWLSGFAVPARRALLMALVAAAAGWRRRRLSPSAILAATCLAVFAADPLTLLAPGFKLSFAAVAVLLAAGSRRAAARPPHAAGWRRLRRYLVELTRLQAALHCGLFPLTVLLFARASLLAPVSNLLVLPLFSLITVPAALAGLVVSGPFAAAGNACLWLAWHSLQLTTTLLDGLAALPGAGWQTAGLGRLGVAAAFLPLLQVLLPPGFPGRRVAWVALVATLLHRPPVPPAGCADVYALDVGQGLAAVVRSAGYTLVYDTGPSFRSGSDTAELALLPFLRHAGIARIDTLVVSHADRDHAGGVESLLAAIPVSEMLVGEPLAAGPPAGRPCRQGPAWQRGALRLRVLHPRQALRHDGNDASCVLEIAAGSRRVLLTGDIGSGVERRLVAEGRLRPVDVAFVAHHGSGTSSSAAFIAALRARHAVVSAGHDNRWGFPKDDVVARWRTGGAEIVTTARDGALRFRLCSDGRVHGPERYRETMRRYWHDL